MIVQVPRTFEDLFLKDFKNHHFSIEDLAMKMKKVSTIHIQEPIYKIKFFLNGVAMRGLLAKKGDILIPLVVFLKDSKEGYNLVLDKKMREVIDNLFFVYQKDFLSGKFTTY